jgi:hypothetical protein
MVYLMLDFLLDKLMMNYENIFLMEDIIHYMIDVYLDKFYKMI